MRKLVISALALLVAGAGLRAQNLDPTVVVTNTYSQQAGMVEKPSQLMEMPDSVLRFNLDFDYSALSVPYRGAYEFKPYLVELRPTVRGSRESVFYLSGGAGYTLHPELDLIWTPLRKDYFRINVYGSHQSYIGNYRSISPQGGWFADDGERWDGARMRSLVGVNTLYTWTGGRLEADIHYRNIYAKDNVLQSASHNAVDFGIRVEGDPEAKVYYIVRNNTTVLNSPLGQETHVVTSAGIGTRFREHYLRLGALADIVSTLPGAAGNLAFTPRYIFDHGDFCFDLGAKLSFLFRSDGNFYPVALYPWSFVFPLFPDARVTYCVIPDSMTLFGEVTGGHIMNTYGSLLEENPFLASFGGMMDASVDRWNASVGARGNISARFYYNLKLGYAFRTNAFLWGFSDTMAPSFGYASKYHMFYTDLSLGWKGDRIDADTRFVYQKTSLNEERLLAPAMFQGSARVVYNWGDRIRAGVTFDGQTERAAIQGSIPGFVDLGLLGDLQMTRDLGFWIKAGNLLNQTVQRVPFYAERGIYFTVGARLIL